MCSNKFTTFKKIYTILLFFCLVIIAFPEYSQARKIDFFAKPQVGLWGGVITPVYTTYDNVGRDLGAGLFFRFPIFIPDLKIGVETAYLDFGPRGLDGVNTLTLFPIYSNLVYRLPISRKIPHFPLTFQVKAGIGGTWIKIRPDRNTQWDPVGMLGFELSFPAGRIFNVGTRVDYLLIYEKHIKGAERNGHIVNAGIELFFNITL